MTSPGVWRQVDMRLGEYFMAMV